MIWLSVGMKKTEEDMLHQSGKGNGSDVGIEKEQHESRVSKALLRGEVTEEVKELRYRTYTVDQEAKGMEFYSPMKALKRDKQDSKFVRYANPYDLELLLIQPNKPDVETIEESMKRLDSKDKLPSTYTLTIERVYTMRFRIEEYTKRLAVFRNGDGKAVLDFYVSKYPNPSDFKSKGFVREIEKIKDEGLRSDIVEIKNVGFITTKAYNAEDFLQYGFKKLKFREIDEYDGSYILRFDAEFSVDGKHLVDEYYSESMAKKYEEKAPKNVTYLYNPYAEPEREYVCSKCGKLVKYSLFDVDNAEPTEARYVEDEANGEVENVTEFMDMEIMEQATGKKLCKECLAKEYDKVMKKIADNIATDLVSDTQNEQNQS